MEEELKKIEESIKKVLVNCPSDIDILLHSALSNIEEAVEILKIKSFKEKLPEGEGNLTPVYSLVAEEGINGSSILEDDFGGEYY